MLVLRQVVGRRDLTPHSATRVHNAKIPAKNGGDFSDVRPEGFEPPAY